MDFLIELVFEIIGGILEAIIESDRVPKWIRYSLLGLIIFGIVALLCIAIVHAADTATIIVLGIVALALVVLFVFFVYNIQKSGVLRLAKQEELPEILKMYRSVIGKPGCNWSVTYPNEVTLHGDFSAGNLYVLCKGSKIIGAGSIVPTNELDDLAFWQHEEKAGEIARIVIAPPYQGKGYGKHLVRKLCMQLEKRGCKAVHLLVSTGNHHALNLYRETGFHNMGQCHRYEHDYYAYERKL